jgi:hypothetical protein
MTNWSNADAFFYASNMEYDYENNTYTDLYGNTVSEDFAVTITNAFYGQTSESNALTVLLNNMPQYSSAEIANNTMWLYYRQEATGSQLQEGIQFQIAAIDVAYGNSNMRSDRFSYYEKATLGLAAAGGYFELMKGIVDNLSGNVKNVDFIKATGTLGKSFGVGSALVTSYETIQDGNFSYGDGLQFTIGLATALTPFGWVYGTLDMAALLTTGTSITGRVGNYVDNHWGP